MTDVLTSSNFVSEGIIPVTYVLIRLCDQEHHASNYSSTAWQKCRMGSLSVRFIMEIPALVISYLRTNCGGCESTCPKCKQRELQFTHVLAVSNISRIIFNYVKLQGIVANIVAMVVAT